MALSSVARLGPLVALLAVASGAFADSEVKYDFHVPSKWNTVNWGIYSAEYAPVLKIKSGAVVKIDIANPIGTAPKDPKKFFVDNGISLDLPVVQEILEIREKTPLHPSGLRGALLT